MLGVIASRRVGNAVKRNRGKRLIREIFRRNFRTLPMLPMLPMLPIGSRFVVVLRSGFDRYGFFELEAHFLKACGKITRKAGPGERSK